MFDLDHLLETIADRRVAARISTPVISKAIFGTVLCRLGSLNAVEQTRKCGFWRRWLGQALPSADTLARVSALTEYDQWRTGIGAVYRQLMRNKRFPRQFQGLRAAVLDAHESHCSYRRVCFGCLIREVSVKNRAGEEVKHEQYYHRNITISIIGSRFDMLLDSEPIFPGEDEVAAALRLLERVLKRYPRAFDVVLGDALYTDSRFYNYLIDAGKYVLTVLKDERRHLFQDALEMFATSAPRLIRQGNTQRLVWDLEGFGTWSQVTGFVRVIRSRETQTVRRQMTKQTEVIQREWVWVTTLPSAKIDTPTAVSLAHGRWNIENRGFNELVSRWSADHVYKHDPVAILNLWLATMLAHNIFMAFFHGNLKPEVRVRFTTLHVVRLMMAELYRQLRLTARPNPP